MLFVFGIVRYTSREEFAADSRLIFDNCNHYNEDDSEVSVKNVVINASYKHLSQI